MSSVEYDTEYDENSSFQICGTIGNDNEGCNINTNFDYVCDRDFPPLEYSRLPNSCKSDWNGVKYYLENQKFTVQSQHFIFNWKTALSNILQSTISTNTSLKKVIIRGNIKEHLQIGIQHYAKRLA